MTGSVCFNPAYSRYIAAQNAPRPDAAPQPSASMPQPDLDLGNRQRTYSVEGLQKLMSWRISLERAYQMVVMPKLQTERASIAQQEREKVLKEL